jgi:hypothetical protein
MTKRVKSQDQQHNLTSLAVVYIFIILAMFIMAGPIGGLIALVICVLLFVSYSKENIKEKS